MGAISELYCGRISAPTDIKVRTDQYDALNARADELAQSDYRWISGGQGGKIRGTD